MAKPFVQEMNKEAEIVNTFFTKSVILSRAAFTYGEAQNRIDDLYQLSEWYLCTFEGLILSPLCRRMNDPLSKNIRILNSLAKILKKKRMEVKVHYDICNLVSHFHSRPVLSR